MGVTNLIGQGIITKFGRNAATVTGDVIQDESSAVLIRTAAGAVEILSSEAADDTGGTGAITVKIYGVDGDWNPIEEIVTLNGVGVVALAKEYLYIHSAKVLTTGTGNVNAGNITIRIASAGATLAMITAEYGQTQKCMFPVYAGCNFLLHNFRYDGVRIGTLTGEIALCVYDESGSKRVIHAISFAGSGSKIVEWLHDHKVLPEKTLVWIEAKNMSASGFCTASFDGDITRYADPQ